MNVRDLLEKLKGIPQHLDILVPSGEFDIPMYATDVVVVDRPGRRLEDKEADGEHFVVIVC